MLWCCLIRDWFCLSAGDPPLSKKETRYLNGRNVEEISPFHNIYKGAPPTIIFQGTADKNVLIQESEHVL